MTRLCSVCFTNSEDSAESYITCYRLDCKSIVCNECAPMLLQFSLDSGIVPKCTGVNCKGVYLTDTIRSLNDQNCMTIYMKAIEKGLMATEEDAVLKKQEYTRKLEQLRNERLEFLRKEIPKAVVEVAKIAFKKRLATVTNSNKKKLAEVLENANTKHRCMNLICDGFLDDKLTCMRCNTVFCNRCEEPTTNGSDHVCNEDNVATVNMKRTMGSCPKCKIPVEKIDGCRHMTCAQCKTKFDYYTGVETPWHGGQNIDIRKQKDKYLLTDIYKSLKPNAKELISKMESMEPRIPKPDTVVNAILAHQKHPNLPLLVGTYCKYTMSHYRAIAYTRAMIEIERLIKEDKLEYKTLKTIVNEWFTLVHCNGEMLHNKS